MICSHYWYSRRWKRILWTAAAAVIVIIALPVSAVLMPESFPMLSASMHINNRFFETSDYTVKKGDMLCYIAISNHVTLDAMLTVNNLDNPHMIHPGQTLKVPNMVGIMYTMKEGETLSDVAERYDLDVKEIMRINRLRGPVLNSKQIFLPNVSLSLSEMMNELGKSFLRPVPGEIISGYGYRSDPFTGRRRMHTGFDFQAWTGQPIRVCKSGEVVYSGWKGGYGNCVIVRHDDEFSTLYGHCSQLLVTVGQHVNAGQVIAKVGSTGRSTGPHLHFEVRRYGRPVNPHSVMYFISR